ncbi:MULTISPECIES: WbqC family protein [Photorhabdus]|uniref:WbqC-like protein family protein n=2 Tax=Photorhabdus TaxID=29487 RepID=A0ABX0B7S3_9GAMM|nr:MULTISPECIES: WbqC family protein [Photorhabdus]MCT8351234.1 WbqC family protein [Photorhabdus kayaii]MDB6368000.1 WbqC family protein [Photorhabdus bodei]NDL13059.1 hypothetical protein [Photorhabdus kayaii]NDL26787.1 hypothetical protein [Photorhabdus kayaii]
MKENIIKIRKMRISIHQPHYLPWLPLIYKIITSEVFVFLDHINYSKNDWVNRNKLKNANGSFILTIPIKKKSSKVIKEISIYGDGWRDKHLKGFYYNYNSAMYFDDIFPFLEEVYRREWIHVSEINYFMLKWVINFLKSDVMVIKSSELGLCSMKNDLLIDICKIIGATEYIAGKYGYENYLDRQLFKKNDISIRPIEWNCPIYTQCYENKGFIPNLSIFDLLMNYGSDSKSILLQGGTLEYATRCDTDDSG